MKASNPDNMKIGRKYMFDILIASYDRPLNEFVKLKPSDLCFYDLYRLENC